MVQAPFIQQKISTIASEELHNRLGVEVKIGNVNFELFNKLIIKDLYLEDQQGKILFQAKRLAVGFDFIPLLNGELRFSNAQLFSFQFNLSKETDLSPWNLQFVIDAFASKDTTKKENKIDLSVRNLNLRRGNFRLNVEDSPASYGKFNPKHLEFNDISAKIHINRLVPSAMDIQVNRLSFKEQSGLTVKRIAFDLAASKKGAIIKKLDVYLPVSYLSFQDIVADFGPVKNKKDYVNKSHLSLKINPSQIRLRDLNAFVPVLENYKDMIEIQGDLSGTMEHLELNNFLLTDENDLTFQADVELNDLNKKEEIYILGIIKESFVSVSGIEKIARNLNDKSIRFPKEILQVGNVRFEGEISGYFHHLKAFGIFNTDVGNLHTEIELGKKNTNFIKGKIKSDVIDLKKIFNSDNYGKASFNIDLDAQQSFNKKYAGKINARIDSIEFKHYLYTNIDLEGKFTDKSFDGVFGIDCPEGKLAIKGFGSLNGEKSSFNFSALAEGVKLDKLNLSKKYKNSELSFRMDVDFKGNNIDNLLGYININDIRFGTEMGGYYLDTLNIYSQILESGKKSLSISSDILHGSVVGSYSFKDIVPAILQTGYLVMPAVVRQPTQEILSENNFSLDFIIKDTEELSYILELPFVLYGETHLHGKYNNLSNLSDFEVTVPKMSVKKMNLEDCLVKFHSREEKAYLSLNATTEKKQKKNKIVATCDIFDNSIGMNLQWNDKSNIYNGNFNLATRFTEQEGEFPLKTEIRILPSEVIFKDSTWTIHPASVVLDSTKIKINQLRIEHEDQFVNINGLISKDPQDNLLVNLNKVNLNYVFDNLNISALDLGGIASGFVEAKDLYSTRQLSTQLKVENFSYNQAVLGDMDLMGLWDEEQQGVKMLGDIHKNDSSFLKVNGMLYPISEKLSITFDAKNTTASFLRKYLDKVTKNISGELTGKIHLFGTFKDVTLEGDVFVGNGSFDVEFLNTTYTFSDYIHLKQDEISLRNVVFKDKFGRQAVASGHVRHDFLSNFRFSLNMNASNFLMFNATEKTNPAFYGSVFGTGFVSLKGDESLINIDVSARSNENTKISLNFMNVPGVSEYDFVNFISKVQDTTSFSLDKYFSQLSNKPILKNNSKSEIKLNLQLEATPDAIIEMIVDPTSGDKIKGYGQGNILILYGTDSPPKLFGKYTMERGDYFFSLHEVIHRDFKIREGSSISFNGDPYDADLNINAAYSLSANIGDLDETLETARVNTPVDCILDITGDLIRPEIKFSIDLPNSGEEIKRQVKSIINTEDQINRQMVYLLVLNKFYTQETGTNTTSRTNDFAAAAAATLSSQLTSLLGSINENFQIGTKFSSVGDKNYTDTEMALMLSSQLLNNRLIFNGNFGYRDNATSNTTFIGDFELEYKLTKSGDFRLKAYNHYNDRYYSLRSAYTTQGLGIIYRKDFNRFSNLFRKRPLNQAYPLYRDSVSAYNEPEFIQFIRKE